MSKRRNFVKMLGIVTAANILGGITPTLAIDTTSDAWSMPDESWPHLRTWMAFGASRAVWGARLLPEVQRNLANIALTIARYEPVAMLVRPSDLPIAKKLMGTAIDLLVCPMDDLWMRDTGPVFVIGEGGRKQAIDFNFNGWGAKQDFDQDAKVASFVAQNAQVRRVKSHLVLEGGAIEVDGRGTAIITESCLLNRNRNPGLTKMECEVELKSLLGLEKIIWLPGIAGKDITDGHTDFYARFARPGTVVAGIEPDQESFDYAVTRRHLDILRSASDAAGQPFEVMVLEAPRNIRNKFLSEDFAAGYVNFYVCNGAVIAPEFGDDKADAAAKERLQTLFPGRDIVQLNIDGIAAGGGGIHCTTQQEPKI